jgi:hypothetical protein
MGQLTNTSQEFQISNNIRRAPLGGHVGTPAQQLCAVILSILGSVVKQKTYRR